MSLSDRNSLKGQPLKTRVVWAPMGVKPAPFPVRVPQSGQPWGGWKLQEKPEENPTGQCGQGEKGLLPFIQVTRLIS